MLFLPPPSNGDAAGRLLGGDHILAALLSPLKLILWGGLALAVAALLMAHKAGLLAARPATRPLAAALDKALPVLSMGVFHGVNFNAAFARLRARRGEGLAGYLASGNQGGKVGSDDDADAANSLLGAPGVEIVDLETGEKATRQRMRQQLP